MSILTIISAILQIVWSIIKNTSEQNQRTRQKRELAIKEAKNAVENKDASSLTSALDRLRCL